MYHIVPVPPQTPVEPTRNCTLSPLGECVLELDPRISSFTVTYTNQTPSNGARVSVLAGTCCHLQINIPPGSVVTKTYNCGHTTKVLFKNESDNAVVEVLLNQ
ncbi:MAG TPA: hypothetical protein VK203_18965 [Nostocaceae cyanobacterium]|nr:hypothetical protein [Nostocaceae cyanobacterium]